MNTKSNAVVAQPPTVESSETAMPPSTQTREPVAQPSLAEARRIEARQALIEKSKRYSVRTLALLAAVLFWHVAARYDLDFYVNFAHVPEPLLVGQALLQELSGSEFYLHIAYSLERIAIAYGLAVVLGVTLGVLMGRSKWAEDIILPYIELLRPIPAVAWIPLAILMLPSEQSSIVFITFLGALFPVVLNTVQGVEQTNGVLVRAARCLGASNRAILWHVIIPGAMPSIVTGLAVGMGVAWFSLLAGEIISGQYGIGYFTWTSYTLIQYPQIIIGMLTIGLLGTICTLLVRLACRPLLRWQPKGGRV